jgi:dihydroorotate dehydrogenase (fumarate)
VRALTTHDPIVNGEPVMDLSINYLGLRLANPLMPGASPLVDDLDMVKRLTEAGAAAFVMHSLFQEQLGGGHTPDLYHRHVFADSPSELLGYYPSRREYALDPDDYLAHIGRVKTASGGLPVIASMNGTSLSWWIEYAGMMKEAGADALELNAYYIPTDPSESSADVERRLLDLIRAVREVVTIPLAVKLSPTFSALPNLAYRIEQLGVDGLVLFNRFMQPDLNVTTGEAVPRLHLSDPAELLLRLRWLAILSWQTRMCLACTGGVETARHVLQAVMAGASAVQVVSALLRYGPGHLKTIREELVGWLAVRGCESVRELRGRASLAQCPDPEAYERGGYLRVLQGARPGTVPDALLNRIEADEPW